ncbi:MAG: Bor family protein [Gemmatimonadetes bacterium]|nr:Bor family protein [Gemmatimonadota bacterium]
MTRTAAMALVATALMLGLEACYEHTVTTRGGAPHGPVVYDHWQNYWLGGLIGHTRVAIEDICPSGRATIVAKQTFLNGLVTALTSGIYSPTTLRIHCADGRSGAVRLDEEDVARVVADPGFLEWVGEDMPERRDEVAAAQATLQDH